MAKTNTPNDTEMSNDELVQTLLEQNKAQQAIIDKQNDNINKLIASITELGNRGAASQAVQSANATEHEKIKTRQSEIEAGIAARLKAAEDELLGAPLGTDGWQHFRVGLKRQDGSYNNKVMIVGVKEGPMSAMQAEDKYDRFFGIQSTNKKHEITPIGKDGNPLPSKEAA